MLRILTSRPLTEDGTPRPFERDARTDKAKTAYYTDDVHRTYSVDHFCEATPLAFPPQDTAWLTLESGTGRCPRLDGPSERG